MAKHSWKIPGCSETETGEWTPDWYDWNGWGQLVKIQCQQDHSGWVHILVAEPGELQPRVNHVHVKYRQGEWKGTSEVVLAVVKIDGVRVINRGELLNKINTLIGTKFSVQDERGE